MLEKLAKNLEGTLFKDALHQRIYATDASVYRKLPKAVIYPKNKKDLHKVIEYAKKHHTYLIPRAAGTSLAGQCVGDGIIVDVSKYLTDIISFDKELKKVTVAPGVVRDDLNRFLAPHGLFFSPNTSTSNRCTIGGMVGNNSSGSTSIQYGTTRSKIESLKVILSDGKEVTFEALSKETFKQKTKLGGVEGAVYQLLNETLVAEEMQQQIRENFPQKNIHRRNTGYAIDALLETSTFSNSNKKINLAELLCGSEGTLAFTTEITLQLDDLPPARSRLVAVHFNQLEKSLEAVGIAMRHNLYMCELLDKKILDCTKNNLLYEQYRFFLKEDPAAILLLEVKADSEEEVESKVIKLVEDLENNNLGYAYPILKNEEINKAFELRKAGLGLLGNKIGDKKAVACIEDTAVALEDLPSYIKEFTKILKRYNQEGVYYAHAGAGELHLRPILNLKKGEDVELFRKISFEVAQLVKKYKGSLSGEHGDGIVRSEFITFMIGETCYGLLEKIKNTFDPVNIFNRGKIVGSPPMDENLRYNPSREEPKIKTVQNFSKYQGILRLAENCNGSGDCRKPILAGGTMCPSYRATRNEKDTTRARANALREFLTHSKKKNKFNHKELKEVFALCLSCKACAVECPSNVDVSALKAEFLHQYYQKNARSLFSKALVNSTRVNMFFSKTPSVVNFLTNNPLVKEVLGIAPKRKMPKLQKETFRKWFKNYRQQLSSSSSKKVLLFVDESTNFYDVSVGKHTVKLLNALGYSVKVIKHEESGRIPISLGYLKIAQRIINKNITVLEDKVSNEVPLVGIEPSSILSFRDEYLRLAEDIESAQRIAKNTFTLEEFLSNEIAKKSIDNNLFTDAKKEISVHVHCHQKALTKEKTISDALSIPKNYTVEILKTGCCGMAGSFGYEKKKYDLSIKIGSESVFPEIQKKVSNKKNIYAVSGTSCRHQILEGMHQKTKHTATVLFEALKDLE